MATRDVDESRSRRRRTSPASKEEDVYDATSAVDPRDSVSQQGARKTRRSKHSSTRRTSRMSSSAESRHRHRHHSELDKPRRRKSSSDDYAPRQRRSDADGMTVIKEETVRDDKGYKIIYIKEQRQYKPKKHRVEDVESPLRRSSTSARKAYRPIGEIIRRDERPALRRSQSSKSSRTPYSASIKDYRRSSFMSIFTPAQKHSAELSKPIRMVQCLTCMDDIPHSKSAKLNCGHRMCHKCLKRIFKLSITDPQHMPPKCCTSEHIPLKHVEKLVDTDFKILWNKKFHEYTTQNRIYCPARRCGEWIKPSSIRQEDGRKYGKCSRCKTKVCCLCNAKWHREKECPKDEATNALLEAAKQAGWQRCFNCRTMVELKEGCNHMTCRCTAEFCMICGSKWKTCNCPWFSYSQVEADRLQHMRVPAQRTYDEDAEVRARPERGEEDLARRISALRLDNYNNEGLGEVQAIGTLDHHMNETYTRPLRVVASAAAQYAMNMPLRQARTQPRVAEEYNTIIRAAERVVPRRTTRDYAAEAAIHSPRAKRGEPKPRAAVLAGIAKGARGSDRVGTWSRWVEPGPPPEGVISVA